MRQHEDDGTAERLRGLGLRPALGGWVPDQPAFPPPPSDDADDHLPDRGRPQAPPPQSTSPLAAALADRLPPALRDAVVAPSGAALFWLAVVGALVLVVVGYVALHRHPAPQSAPPVHSPVAPVVVATPTAAPVVVDVGGRVRKPGLVTLPFGSRVADAVAAAGGVLRQRDLASVNLAARVTDGELLLVGVPGAATPTGGSDSGASAGPVDINTATIDQLETLPRVGPVMAQRILDWRTAHGGFRSIDDLRQVSGIGAATFSELQPLVTV